METPTNTPAPLPLDGLRIYGFDMDPDKAWDGRIIPPHWLVQIPYTKADHGKSITDKQAEVDAFLAARRAGPPLQAPAGSGSGSAPAAPAGGLDREATIGLMLRYCGVPNAGDQDPYYQSAARMLDAALSSTPAPSTVAPAAGSRCTWYQIEEGAETWESTCGLCYYFEDPPTADECKYCNKCGKPLDLEPWTPDEDEDEPEPSTPSQAPGHVGRLEVAAGEEGDGGSFRAEGDADHG